MPHRWNSFSSPSPACLDGESSIRIFDHLGTQATLEGLRMAQDGTGWLPSALPSQ